MKHRGLLFTVTPGLLLALSCAVGASTVSYRYDALHRLTEVRYGDGTVIAYTYDPAGNRTRKTIAVASPGDSDGDGLDDDVDPFPFDPDRPGEVGTLRLQPGTNLIGYMVGVDPAHGRCMGLIADLGGAAAIGSLARLNPALGRFEVCSADNDFLIEAGAAYLIDARAPVTRGLATDPVCADLVLAPGQNLRGHPNPALGCYAWLGALGADLATAIQRFDPATSRIETCAFTADGATVVGVDFPVRPGGGYIVTSRTGGVFPILDCD